MEPDHHPNPKRFEVFTQIPNKKGFKIKGSKYIYFFDKYGGWYDEYNNYYNPDGEADDHPSDEDVDFERFVLESEYFEGDDDDYFDREYGGHAHDDYEEDHHYNSEHQKVLEAIARNQTVLHEYPVNQPLRVDFQNMSFKATKQEILKHYRSKVGKGLLNVIMTKEDGKFIGEGYFVCKEVSTAEKLIKYEGEQFLGRKVYFDVEPVEDFLNDPVTREEQDIPVNEEDFEPLVKEKPKVQTKAQEPKEQQKGGKKKYLSKTSVTEQKKQVQKKTEPAKVQQPKKEQASLKKQQPKQPTWSKYLGEVTMFPKKTSFKQWMNKQGFNDNEHFKNPEKVDSKDPKKRFANVELRSDVYQKIEGSLYEGQKVHFQKVE